jgi:hypothetical protein
MSTKSQVDKLLEAFKRGEHLSDAYALSKYSIADLTSEIKAIESSNFHVSRYWHHPRDAQKYMIYFMLPDQFRKVA